MTPAGADEDYHPAPTTGPRRIRYYFSPKHHGRGGSDAATWLQLIARQEEFSIIEEADLRNLADGAGNLYGVLRAANGTLRRLGIWNEEMAEFPVQRGGEAWHGYPNYPLVEMGPQNRRGQKCRPEKVVFQLMLQAGVITRAQKKRLMGAHHT
jgi:hypothetical protein